MENLERLNCGLMMMMMMIITIIIALIITSMTTVTLTITKTIITIKTFIKLMDVTAMTMGFIVRYTKIATGIGLARSHKVQTIIVVVVNITIDPANSQEPPE